MLVIPAIDLRDGRCVRLVHGKKEEETVYSSDPVAVAKKWMAAGATRLHVIDLDGAFSGEPKNLDWILKIKKETKSVIQMGGGLRSMAVIDRILAAGIDRVILGTVIVEEAGLAKSVFEKYKNRVMVALDVAEGFVAVHGWKDNSGFPVKEAVSIVEKLGGQEVIFTDIGRDGTMKGVNVAGVEDMMKLTKMKIYASGGVSTLEDVQKLKSIGSPGCIVGKSIYEGRLDLAQAIKTASN